MMISIHSLGRFGALAAVAATLMTAGAAWAGDITVTDAWARASAGPSKTGAAFVTLTNTGSSDDALLSAEASSVSKVTQLHTHIKDGDVMRMRQVEKIDVPAGQTVTLQPGGLHVMFLDLQGSLTEGQTFPMTLTFAKAGTVETTVTVKTAGAMNHDMSDHSKMDHGTMGGMDHSMHKTQ